MKSGDKVWYFRMTSRGLGVRKIPAVLVRVGKTRATIVCDDNGEMKKVDKENVELRKDQVKEVGDNLDRGL